MVQREKHVIYIGMSPDNNNVIYYDNDKDKCFILPTENSFWVCENCITICALNRKHAIINRFLIM